MNAIKHCMWVLTFVFGVCWGQYWSPLQSAAQRGDLQACKLLIQITKDLNSTGPTSYPPVFLAFKAGHQKIVKFLLKQGASNECCWDKEVMRICTQKWTIEYLS